MWFESLIRTETGCAAYMIGSLDTGECAVFDPLWDVEPYIETARRKKATIRYVIDSHSHADHVSGARRLAAETGAELILPELAEVTYAATRVKGGDRLTMGEVSMDVLHVPGHRPEQINLLITDHSRGEDPWCLLTADFLLVGDVARPDLAQEGVAGAETLFDVALPRLRDLPEFVEVYPGHVAGST
jgi:hydroxyacylglutathione hydrolase